MSGSQLTATALYGFTHTAANGSAARGSEVVAYDAGRNLVFVLGATGVDALDANTGTLKFTLPREAVTVGGTPLTLGTGNSVAVHGNMLAVAYEGATRVANGAVALYDLGGTAASPSATLARVVQPTDAPGAPASFAQPDMVTFTPDGTKLLVAIEGEPADGYAADPLGGVGIITVATGALTVAGFGSFDAATLKAAGVRITGQSGPTTAAGTATAAADLEPEYIAISANGATAYVTLQDNNALAVLDIASATVRSVVPFGLKDHNTATTGLDGSDRDGGAKIAAWPLKGLYQPDGIATFQSGGSTYIVTANEGDAREWGSFVEAVRISAATLDPTAFPTAVANILKNDANIGRLEVSRITSDTDGDGDLDRLDVFGGRGFSIWKVNPNDTLTQVWDSGEKIDEILAAVAPQLYDDTRSDNKGAEPEGLTLGTVDGQLYAFVGLERANSVMAFSIDTSGATPTARYAGLVTTPGDVAPEVFTFIPGNGGADGKLVVANETSGTTRAYTIDTAAPGNYTLQILHASDFEAGLAASANAPRFAAIVDKLEDSFANSITLSSGDNFIPGPFLSAGGDAGVRTALQNFYKYLLGDPSLDLSGLREASARVDIAMLNGIGVQASVFGNHEFDLGTTILADAIDMIAGTTGTPSARVSSIGAQFPYLSANLDFTGTNPLGIGGAATGDAAVRGLYTDILREASTYATTATDLSSNQNVANEAADAQIAPWTTIVENGQTIGVLGLTTQILRQISSPGNIQIKDPANDGGLDNTSELAQVLQPYIDQMTALGINKIILLSHLQQNALERDLATKLSGVDIIIAGGSHAVFADSTDALRPGDTADQNYPVTLTAADGKPILVVNTGAEYSYVGRLAVTFDGNGVLIADPDGTGALGIGGVDPAISGAYATTDAVVQQVWGSTNPATYFADGTRGGEVKKLADAVQAVINAKDGNFFGYTNVFLDGRRVEVRTEETNLGNISADANLWTARQADQTVTVSLKNGGGIRAEIGAISTGAIPVELPPIANPSAGKPSGAVSQLDIENSLRFNNALSVATFTATNLVKLIENTLVGVAPGATPGGFPQVGGLSFSFDATRPAGSRLVNLTITNADGSIADVLVRGGAIAGNAAREIRVVMLSFSLDGGDGWTNGGVTFTNRVNLSSDASTAFTVEGKEQQALADYLAANFATPGTAYNALDTAPAADTRIQNLAARADAVLPLIYITIGGSTVAQAAAGYTGATPGLVFQFDGTAAAETVLGTASADALSGAAGADWLDGAGGNDSLSGGTEVDTLLGGAGNDTLDGGDGADILVGGAGNDTYIVGGQSDLTIEQAGGGTDTVRSTTSLYLYAEVENLVLEEAATNGFGVGTASANGLTGNSGANLLIGLDGNDTLLGLGGADTLFGGVGNDSVDGGTGADALVGGLGDDTYVVDAQADLVFENTGEGTDTVRADLAGGGFYLYANLENLTLLGTAQFGVGNTLGNAITGNGGANTLLGGDGADTLNGGAGNDYLFGQAGADVFVGARGIGGDVVMDFAIGTDKLDVRGIGYASFAAFQATLSQVGPDVAVDLGLGDFLVLIGVQGSALGSTDVLI